MRAYIAIVADGFRQAFRTRILWVLLVMITLVLAAAAPIGYREDLTIGLSTASVDDWRALLSRMRDQARQQEASPGRVFWSRFDEDLRNELEALGPLSSDGGLQAIQKQQRTLERFQQAVDAELRQPDLYDPDTWGPAQVLPGEARQLLQKRNDASQTLSEREQLRLNRLLLESAYPDQIAASPRTSLAFQYLGKDLGVPLALWREQFNDLLRRGVAWILSWIVGGAGILVAIVVTAPIIPQMFDPGSLHLLLSKPISRSLLFLAKFLAGCAFILILATYLIGGAWLILGFRFDIWDPQLLWSIPIYTFVFAVYYSVSAFAGVLYRGSVLSSAIMSISVSCLFWLICFLVGTGKIGMENTVLNKNRVVAILPTDAGLMSVNEMGFTSLWDEQRAEWREIFDTEEQRMLRPSMYVLPNIPSQLRPLGPVFDTRSQRLLAVQRSLREGNQSVYVGRPDNGWAAERGIAAPVGTVALRSGPDDQVLAISSLGIHQLEGDPLKRGRPVKVLGMSLPISGSNPFKPVGPTPAVVLMEPLDVALDPDSGDLALYTRGALTLLSRDEQGTYVRTGESVELTDDRKLAVLVAYAGNTLLLAWADGRIEVRDAETQEVRLESTPEAQTQPRFVQAAPGGRWFSIVFHDGSFWLYDARKQEFQRPAIRGQGDISAAEFAGSEQILIADRTARVSRYNLDSMQVVDSYTPTMGMMESAYRYVLVPLYTLFPKPGELNKTLQYLLSGKETASDEVSTTDLAMSQTRLRPWAPLWSSLAFMAGVLVLACVYIERQQF